MCKVETIDEALLQQQQEMQGESCKDVAIGTAGTNVEEITDSDKPSDADDDNDKDRWMQKYGLLVFFFVTVFACAIVYIWAVRIKVKGLEENQKRIVEIYERHTVKKNINSKQPFMVFQQSQDNREIFEEEIKSLLEVQQSYIQDNFGSFEIWAGILTIVFLVFSFFSLQKSEQMEQQSRESLKRIKRNMRDSASKLSTFDNNASSKLSDFESKSTGVIGSFKTQYESQIKNFQDQSTSALGGINAKMEEAKTATLNEGKVLLEGEREKASNDFVDKLNIIEQQILSEFDTTIEGKKNDVEKALTSAQMRLETLLKEIENLEHKIKSVTQNGEEAENIDEEALPADEIDD